MDFDQLVEFVRIFSFSGIVVLVDKVDETQVTQSSSEMTSRLIHPLLAHIQLLEISGFAWMFFLWAQVKSYFESGAYPVRLDKIAHATIEWEYPFFQEMFNSRNPILLWRSAPIQGFICGGRQH